MRVSIVNFPGSSGAEEMRRAYEEVLKAQVTLVWHKEERLPETDLVILPNGASFGDYLRPGALAKCSAIIPAIKKAANMNIPILGVGNGFQILCEVGLLPGILLVNDKLNFENSKPHIVVTSKESFCTKKFDVGKVLQLPVSCCYGRFYANKKVMQDIEENEQVVFRYSDQFGETDDSNPFLGSANSIAGIKNKTGTILGMMPRPERAVDNQLGAGVAGLDLLGFWL